MPRIRPGFDSGTHPRRAGLATIGRFTTRAGTILTLTAAPLALATFLSILLGTPTLAVGLDAAMSAATGPLVASGGVEWLLHVGVLGLLAGCWLLGAGLVLSGLTD